MDKEIYNTVKTYVSGTVAVLAVATQTGDGVDLRGHEAATVSFIIGDAGITWSGTNKFTLIIQDSDDDVTYADCVDADVVGATISATGIVLVLSASSQDESTYDFGYIGDRRYVRAVIVGAGTHGTGTALGSVVNCGYPVFASAR